jgi:serine/threonine protein phosphatase PrpC
VALGVEEEPPPAYAFEAAALTDAGTERARNEDSCACLVQSPTAGVMAVADGVSSYPAGDVASSTAIEAVLRAFRQPAALRLDRRLRRAVQQANIGVYDLAVVVPELRGMATTLTALAIDRGQLAAAHVGDCRLYLIRGGRCTQLTKDHTVTGERVRLGLLSEKRALHHPDRSVLTRSVGRELIVAIDLITTSLVQGDVLILCSDGLYNVLDEAQMEGLVRGRQAGEACRALIERANQRGTVDNLTAAVLRMIGATPEPPRPGRPGARLRGWIGRSLGRSLARALGRSRGGAPP